MISLIDISLVTQGPQHDKLVCQKHIKCHKLQRLFIAIAKLHIILKVSDATVLPNYALQDVTSITRNNIVTTEHHQDSQIKKKLRKNIVFQLLVMDSISMEMS